MPVIPPGITYNSQGKLRLQDGTPVLEFDADLNPLLHEKFYVNLSQLVGHEVDISGLPDVLVFDPGLPEEETFNIVRDDERPGIEAILPDIQQAFDLPTIQHARAAARIMWRIARRF